MLAILVSSQPALELTVSLTNYAMPHKSTATSQTRSMTAANTLDGICRSGVGSTQQRQVQSALGVSIGASSAASVSVSVSIMSG